MQDENNARKGKMAFRYHEDSCGHYSTEFVGGYHRKDVRVDVYFLDETGGHNPDDHGVCLRYSDDPGDYASGPAWSYEKSDIKVWELYRKWCMKKGYKLQDLNWRKAKDGIT
ncbi:uncharacterized protein METZ01_LOCUS228778 [marine metagenome]|uniref:Uncharacterized protein n=1 Tax=marine metagenome TaxID=408172 RepID=A0A382GM90_9ZZZZ